MDWVKPGYNPIVPRTNRDPTTAWRTAAGEWRYTAITKDIWSSWDFKTWTNVARDALDTATALAVTHPLTLTLDTCH